LSLAQQEIEQLRELFGPPPALASEEPERFEKLFIRLATSIKPQDFMELLLIWHFTCESWNLNRYARHATFSIERRRQEQLYFEAQRAKLQETRRLPRSGTTFANAVAADIAALANLEEKVLAVDEEVGEILDRKASERDHNLALQRSIVFQDQLDKLMNSATRRRNDALNQLEIYRTGLGAHAKELAEQILDGEFEEAIPIKRNAPALLPPDEVTARDSQ